MLLLTEWVSEHEDQVNQGEDIGLESNGNQEHGHH